MLPQGQPDRRVVARPFEATNLAVNPGGAQARRQRRAEQEVVDPQPGVAPPAIALVVPEGVERALRVAGAKRIDPALIEQASEGGTAGGLQQRIALPRPGRIDVGLGRVALSSCRQTTSGRACASHASRFASRRLTLLMLKVAIFRVRISDHGRRRHHQRFGLAAAEA